MSTVILSCTTLLQAVAEAQKVNQTSYKVIELDRKYHEDPSRMRDHIVSVLESLPEDVDTVLIAMGFCGGSWQGVSYRKKLVMPRVADCVALTLVTGDRYEPDLKKPGHMYLFGEGESGFSVHAIYEDLVRNHDPEMADIVFDMYFENYYHLDIVDNGLYDCYDPAYVERAQQDAERIHSELDYVEGSNLLLEQLISGKWDEKFLVVSPGEKITQSLFYDS